MGRRVGEFGDVEVLWIVACQCGRKRLDLVVIRSFSRSLPGPRGLRGRVDGAEECLPG